MKSENIDEKSCIAQSFSFYILLPFPPSMKKFKQINVTTVILGKQSVATPMANSPHIEISC